MNICGRDMASGEEKIRISKSIVIQLKVEEVIQFVLKGTTHSDIIQ